MSKYTEQFKHQVVQDYLSGGGGYKALSQRHGMANRSLVERWVMAYQLHGDAGLRKKPRSRYDADFKLSVLQHMWENRLSYAKVTLHFKIEGHNTLRRWARQYRENGVAALMPDPSRQHSRMTIPTIKPEPKNNDQLTVQELIEQNNQLRMENAYLKKLQALVQSQASKAPVKKRK